jgi:hypothetical protein
MEEMTSEVEAALREALDSRGKLACPDARRIAEQHGVSIGAVGDWANREGIKICGCSLGCFP